MIAPTKERSDLMRRIRSSGTWIELEMKELAKGLRCRTNVQGLPGTPDLANKQRKIAIFAHGCFFHGHHCSRLPKTNTEFWAEKRRRNRARDRRVIWKLWQMGYTVMVVWECELKKDRERVRTRLRCSFR